MNYHCVNQKILARETIHEALEKLPANFIQTHKFFIVNKENILSFTSNELTIGKEKIPISETYKNEVLKRVENNANL